MTKDSANKIKCLCTFLHKGLANNLGLKCSRMACSERLENFYSQYACGKYESSSFAIKITGALAVTNSVPSSFCQSAPRVFVGHEKTIQVGEKLNQM